MENVGIYVHVPFCQQKCRYCDFPSWAGLGEADARRYFEAVCLEIRAFAAEQGRLSARTVYFGGGTPSYVAADHIGQVMDCIQECFEPVSYTHLKMQGLLLNHPNLSMIYLDIKI